MPAAREGSVPFVEAVAFLKDRLALSDSEWQALLRAASAQADSVVDAQAEAMRRDLLAAIAEIYAAGGTADDFKARHGEIASRYGWASAGDPGWHSTLIWRMETFGARAAGRWEQARRLQRARPNVRYYFRYVTAGDHRVRDTHKSWHGIILPIDHWFWHTHFPPNGFNCRCHVQVVSERDLLRYGWSVTSDSDPRLAVAPDDGFAGNAGLAWETLRGKRPAPSAPDRGVLSVAGLVEAAETLPPDQAVEIGAVPDVVAERLGATRRAVSLSADTVARHRHHGEADANAYGALAQRLLATGQFVTDPLKPNHIRVIGELGGQIWAAVLKVDRHGRIWLQSLHRSNRRQMRKWMGR